MPNVNPHGGVSQRGPTQVLRRMIDAAAKTSMSPAMPKNRAKVGSSRRTSDGAVSCPNGD